MRFRQHWRLAGGALLFVPPLWQFAKWLLQVGGSIDFLIERINNPGWVASVISWLLSPPPSLNFPLVLSGLALIWWHFRHNRHAQIGIRNKSEVSTETAAFGAVLTVSVRHLFTFFGATRHALIFTWSTGATGVFDKIEGHEFDIYTYDFDSDGAEELIAKYHCGAHTHVMRVYKILPPPEAPMLIPGAEIGSDFPEIKWKLRHDGHGVVIYASNRNWDGSPASDPPVTERYIFESGRCMRIPPDRSLED